MELLRKHLFVLISFIHSNKQMTAVRPAKKKKKILSYYTMEKNKQK